MGENLYELEYYTVASIEEIEEGNGLLVEIGDRTVIIYKVQGQFFAIGDICSHDGGPLHEGDLDEYIITCPRHGAKFDVRSGKVLSLPAVVDIPTFPVRVVGNTIEVGIPKD